MDAKYDQIRIQITAAKSANDLKEILSQLPKCPWNEYHEQFRVPIKKALVEASDRIFQLGSGAKSPSEEDFTVWMKLAQHTY